MVCGIAPVQRAHPGAPQWVQHAGFRRSSPPDSIDEPFKSVATGNDGLN